MKTPDFDAIELLKSIDFQAQSKKPPEHPADGRMRRIREILMLGISAFCVIAVQLLCIAFVAFRPDSPSAGVALNGSLAIAMGVLGYYVRARTL